MDDPDFDQAVEDVANEINAKRTFREHIKEMARTARLFVEVVWYHWRGRGKAA